MYSAPRINLVRQLQPRNSAQTHFGGGSKHFVSDDKQLVLVI